MQKLLLLESTCDETAAAVVTDELEVLASVVASQDKLHERYGGVVPEIASRAHVERILPVIDETLKRAGVTLAEIDAVAVANTPGLAGSLLVGLAAAKSLCLALGVPLIATPASRRMEPPLPAELNSWPRTTQRRKGTFSALKPSGSPLGRPG